MYSCIFVSHSGGVDYFGVSGTFNFDSANTLICVNVGINDDSIPEDTECFNFRLISSGTDVVVTQVLTPINIFDNDSKYREMRNQATEVHQECSIWENGTTPPIINREGRREGERNFTDCWL